MNLKPMNVKECEDIGATCFDLSYCLKRATKCGRAVEWPWTTYYLPTGTGNYDMTQEVYLCNQETRQYLDQPYEDPHIADREAARLNAEYWEKA